MTTTPGLLQLDMDTLARLLDTQPDHQRVCNYYGRGNGCHNGDACSFVHIEDKYWRRAMWKTKRVLRYANHLYYRPYKPYTELPPCTRFVNGLCPLDEDCPLPHYVPRKRLYWRRKI